MIKLEHIANFAVIALCCVAGAVLVHQEFLRAGQNSVAVPLKGKTVNLEGTDWTRTKRSLVMVVSSHCRFCRESAPFYEHLAAVHDGNPASFQLLAVSSDRIADLQAFFLDHHIRVDRTITPMPATLDVHATPTLLIVDSGGRVQEAFVGILDASTQSQVIRLLQQPGS